MAERPAEDAYLSNSGLFVGGSVRLQDELPFLDISKSSLLPVEGMGLLGMSSLMVLRSGLGLLLRLTMLA
jgi:hypothetical protein